MAKTLLNCVNETLKRTGWTAGDAGALTTLTNSARQHPIDVAIQIINEGIVALYSTSEKPLPKGQAQSTITLVAGQRDYTLATDLVQLRWPFIDKTNNQYLLEQGGGYNTLLEIDPEQDDTGLPYSGAIRPTDGKIFLDRAPTSAEAGRVYTYQYDKSLLMSAAADTVPFGDEVFTMMVPCWAHLFKREMRREFDADLFRADLGVASGLLTQQQPRTSWSPR